MHHFHAKKKVHSKKIGMIIIAPLVHMLPATAVSNIKLTQKQQTWLFGGT